MKIFNHDEVKQNMHIIDLAISEGSVFIYPTDTIYGIGCDATNDNAVLKVRELKDRQTNPFSVIAPSLKWIKKNCIVRHGDEKWLEKLPGPYTLIMKLKHKNAISEHVNCGMGTVGIRIPNHWISDIAKNAEKPIVTTSANKEGQDFMTSIEDLDSGIKDRVDYIFYEGELDGKPSKLVNLSLDETIVKER